MRTLYTRLPKRTDTPHGCIMQDTNDYALQQTKSSLQGQNQISERKPTTELNISMSDLFGTEILEENCKLKSTTKTNMFIFRFLWWILHSNFSKRGQMGVLIVFTETNVVKNEYENFMPRKLKKLSLLTISICIRTMVIYLLNIYNAC